jgi:formate dehydrogenase
MNATVVDTSRLRKGIRNRPKGRQVDPRAADDIAALLGDAPRERDYLIEHLHRIQDRYGCLTAAHLAALAAEMKLAMTEVYEVATFYHHFDVVKEDEAAPPAITVRVCETLSCRMAGADALRAELAGLEAAGVRVLPAPCIGPLRAGARRRRGSSRHRSRDGCEDRRRGRCQALEHRRALLGYAQYRAKAATHCCECVTAGARRGRGDRRDGSSRCAVSAARFPAAQVEDRARRARRRAMRSTSTRASRQFKDRYYLERDRTVPRGMLIAAWAVASTRSTLPARRVRRVPRILTRELAALRDPPCPCRRSSCAAARAPTSAAKSRRMIESIEGQARHAASAPAVRRASGLFDRPTLEHNMETLSVGARHRRTRGASWFAAQGRNGRKGLRSFSVSGRVKKPGVHLAPAGHHGERADRRVLRRHAGRARLLRLPARRRVRGYPARIDGRHPLDFDTLQPHGCFIGSAAVIILSDHDRARDAALNMMEFFADESCGQCTPCRVGTEKAAG